MSLEKFNGFSQEEINKVSNRLTTTVSKTYQNKRSLIAGTATIGTNNSKHTLKQAFRGTRDTGIRRMPETWSKPSSTALEAMHAKQQQPQQQLGTKTATANTKARTMTPTTTTTTTLKSRAEQDSTNNRTSGIPNSDSDSLSYNPNDSMSISIQEALYFQPLRQQRQQQRQQNLTPPANGNNGNTSDDSSILNLSNLDSTEQEETATDNDDSIIQTTTTASAAAAATAAAGIARRTQNMFVDPQTLNTNSPFRGISLKDFESHRKLIEEQNKQKKEMLYKAIEHHSQKTAAEARKIEEIKSELTKLDNDLAIDVAILRKQIDNACIHFANVEKQYIKIEAQFLKAKMELHQAAEKKELLTEHLCTVIAHNEDRKAQKLTELMEKVGLSATGELNELNAQ